MSARGELERAHASEVVWHDLECGGYRDDLEALAELCRTAAGRNASARIVELGAGTGRVAIELAGRGIDVVAIERDPELAAELERRTGEAAAQVSVIAADVAEADPGPGFDLVLAPMQFAQLFAPAERRSLLARIAAWLRPGGLFAAAILDDADAAEPPPDASPPLPDVLERDGWLHSSLPVRLWRSDGRINLIRLRQSVSPAGELTDSESTTVLWELGEAELSALAAEAGLEPVSSRRIESELHVDSRLCVWRRR